MAGPGPGDPDEQYDFLFKLVLVGDASVGKTCVVQRFKTGVFSERQGSTIGVDFTMKTLEIQGQRVKVGGPARGRRAAGPHGARGRPGPWRVSPEGSGSGAAASTRLVLGGWGPLWPPVRAGLGLGVGAGLWAQSAGLGALGCACWGECGGEALPSELHAGGLCSRIASPVPGGRAPRVRARGAPGRPTPAPPRSRAPARPSGGGPQAERDTPTTRRDQEVVASRTGGPKLFVRISGLATPPCSLFVDLVVELYSAGAARVPSPSCSPIGTENFTGPGRWGRGPRFGSGSALNRQDVAATESWQWSDN
nr:collagen alpha-2(I) chain-like [Globicephala melas]